MSTTKIIRHVLVVIAAATAFAACDGDDGTSLGGGGTSQPAELTAAWEGEWDLEVVGVTCGTTDTLLYSSGAEFLCDGDDIRVPFLPWEFSCEGTVSDTRIDVECDSAITIGPCRLTVTVDWIITRAGDDLSGTAQVMFVPSALCDPDTTLCMDVEFTGTRIGDGSAGCVVASALRPWRIGQRVGIVRRPSWDTP